jgi:2-hydroxycyclohexanecarboxyl-CoA dehydrogenase
MMLGSKEISPNNVSVVDAEAEHVVQKDLLQRRIILVAGSTKGIGVEIARQAARANAEGVIISGRNAEDGNKAANELRTIAKGTDTLFVQSDLRDPASVASLFGRSVEHFGRIDAYVHAAGVGFNPAIFAETDPSTFRPQLDANLFSLFTCCSHAVPLLRKQGGAIITIASDSGKVPTPGEAIIGAVKAGVIMFTRTLAREEARHKIRANCITPSLVAETPAYDRLMADPFSGKLFRKVEARAALGLATPADIAGLAVFLASSLGARITGQAISVNGGVSAA